ncbi:MAG: MBL fold metallo-hydrolase, partial [Thaumarchaeota archaeon]|nr:MBL fold metallo-hydrolase [Nitrososphaerota archaeon]
MELRVLGGAREVGRSAFLLKTRRTSILMDYGALTRQEPAFPMHVSPRDVDAIFLTHAHLDHSGGIPIFYISKGPELYATPLTLDTTELLIKDFIHLSGFYLPFDYIDLESMMRRATRIENGDEVEVGDVTVKFIDAGHIPGSSMFLVEANGKRILYTGDVNSTDTALLKGARPKIGELDLLITESTYALEDHPDRKKTE